MFDISFTTICEKRYCDLVKIRKRSLNESTSARCQNGSDSILNRSPNSLRSLALWCKYWQTGHRLPNYWDFCPGFVFPCSSISLKESHGYLMLFLDCWCVWDIYFSPEGVQTCPPTYATLVCWLFWAEVTWQTATTGRSFLWTPLICLQTDPAKEAQQS